MPQHIRVTTGTMEEMEGFVQALKDVLNIDSVAGQAAGAFGLLEVSPNPLAERCEIKFYVPQQGLVRIIVYDMNGNPVARPANMYLPSGKHSVSWNCRGANGNELNPGFYTILLLQGEFASSQKISIVK